MRVSFCIVFFLLFSLVKLKGQSREVFSANEVRADLKFLYENLQAAHFNLFVNTSQKTFNKKYQEIHSSIKDSLNLLQINRLFQPFVALAQLGHCNAGYPFKAYNSFLSKGGKVFPFDVQIDGRRVYITGNYSKDSTLKPGDEIVAFYGVPAHKWLEKLYGYLSGENETFKNTLVDLIGFPRLHWIVYDNAKVYSLKIRKRDGKVVFVNDEGITAAQYREIRNRKATSTNSERILRFFDQAAYLKPGAFLNTRSGQGIGSNQTFEKGEFVQFIDSSFLQIHRRNAKQLIIDLRGNPGGDNSFSDPMIAYFATEPFSFCSSFLVKTSSLTKSFWTNVTDPSLASLKNRILGSQDGEIFENKIEKYLPRTDSLKFKGKVYILIDRYTYSNATTVAAIVQDYKFGTLIGEVTAESPTLFAAAHEFSLPNSGISITYPKALIIRPSGDKKLTGVVPEFIVRDDPFTSDDEVLEWTLRSIK